MAYKTDGKSSSSSNSNSSENIKSSNYQTQGTEKEEYIAYDISDRTDYKRPDTSRQWLYVGTLLAIAFALYCIQKSEYQAEMAVVQERVQADQLRMQEQQHETIQLT